MLTLTVKSRLSAEPSEGLTTISNDEVERSQHGAVTTVPRTRSLSLPPSGLGFGFGTVRRPRRWSARTDLLPLSSLREGG